jgi:hypothetical protein
MIGALLTEPPRSADAVRVDDAGCVRVEFIADGAANEVDGAGKAVVVGPLK